MFSRNYLPVIPGFQYDWPTAEIYSESISRDRPINWFVNFERNLVYVKSTGRFAEFTYEPNSINGMLSVTIVAPDHDGVMRTHEASSGEASRYLNKAYEDFITESILLKTEDQNSTIVPTNTDS